MYTFCLRGERLTRPTHNQTALVLAAQQGDEAALSRLAAEMMPFVWRLAAKYKSVLLDRDDLFQEGMLGLLSAVRSFSPERGASFRTYAAVCVNNRIVSALRGANGVQLVPLDDRVLPDAAQSPEEAQLLRDAYETLLQRMRDRLSATEQTVLHLFLNGLSYREIAEETGLPQKAVDNALQRARRKLRG